jgi:outer membrane protein assembly factor BamB
MASERRRIFVEHVPQTMPRRQRPINLPGTPVRITGDGRIAAIDRESRKLIILDNELEPIHERFLADLPRPQAETKFERLIILPDLTAILLGPDQVVCVDSSGRQRWSVTHPTWPRGIVGGDAVVVDQNLVVVVPERAAPSRWTQVPAAQLAVVDIRTGSVSDRVPLVDEIGHPQGFHAITRRGGTGGALDGGYGQDGAQIWRITAPAAHVEATPLGAVDRVLGDLSPNGAELLTTPHYDGGLIIYRWENLTEAARLERAQVFELEQGEDDETVDRFDYSAWFLSDNRLLASTRQGRLLVIDRSRMTVESQLVPSGFDIIGYDEGGQPVDDASQALDFDGAISGVTVIDETRILVHGKDRRVDLCEI